MKRVSIMIALMLSVLTGCSRWSASSDDPTLQVAASFYPLAYVAEQIGGDDATVTTIVPNGVEPHDFAPTPQDIVAITAADVVISNGGGLDDWVTKVAADVPMVQATSVTTSADPHVWLDPVLMQDIVNAVRDAFSQTDPTHAVAYEENAEVLLTKLQRLDHEFETDLANCEIRQAIVSHDAFNYLAQRYDIELLAIAGMNPNETPSAQTLAELSTVAKSNQIEYIFFEELTSPKLSETLANEVGAQTLVLSPLEGLTEEEQQAGEDYLSIMERNLENLALAMRCQ